MGVAFVPLNLEWSSRRATQPWPKDAVVRVTDSNGTVVAAYPQFSDVGQRLDVLAPAGATKGFVVATSRISKSNDSLGV